MRFILGLLMLSGHAMDRKTDQSAIATNLKTPQDGGLGGAEQQRLHDEAVDQTNQRP